MLLNYVSTISNTSRTHAHHQRRSEAGTETSGGVWITPPLVTGGRPTASRGRLPARRAQPTHEAKREQMPAGRSATPHLSLYKKSTKREQMLLGRFGPCRNVWTSPQGLDLAASLFRFLRQATSKKNTNQTRSEAGTDAVGQVWTSPPLTHATSHHCHLSLMLPLTHGASHYRWARDCSASKSEQRELSSTCKLIRLSRNGRYGDDSKL